MGGPDGGLNLRFHVLESKLQRGGEHGDAVTVHGHLLFDQEVPAVV